MPTSPKPSIMELFDSTRHGMLTFFSNSTSLMYSGISFLLQPIFLRGFAGSLHLVLLLGLFLYWVCKKIRGNRVEGSKEKFKHRRVLWYKQTLVCCLGVSVFDLVLCLLSYFYWYRNSWSDEKLVTLLDLALRTLAWGAVGVYLHTGFSNSGESKFPLPLRVWWGFYLFISCYCLVIDIVLYRKQVSLPVQFIVSDIVSVLTGLFLCYVWFPRNEGENTLLEEPLLNGNVSSTNGVEVNTSKGGDVVTPYSNAGTSSLLSFSWIGPLIAIGNKKTLDLEDVPQLSSCDSVVGAFPTFRNKLESASSGGRVTAMKLVKALFFTAWKEILWTVLLAILYTMASYVGPYLIDTFVQYLNGRREFKNEGYVLVATFFVAKLVQCLSQRQWYFRMQQFLSKIIELRKTEASCLKKFVYTSAITTFVFWGTPTFVAVATFGTCMILGIPLESGKILSALATFRILQQPIYTLPDTISMIVQTKVSIDRIASFLCLDDLPSDIIEQIPRGSSDIAIEIVDDFIELVGAHKKALSALDSAETEPSSEKVISGKGDDVMSSANGVAHKQENKDLQNGTSEDTAGPKGQLIQEEEREKGRVGFSVYWKYNIMAYGGALVPFILLSQILFQILQIGSNYWMAWATPVSADAKPAVGLSTLMLVYVALAIGSSFCVLSRVTLLVTAGYTTATLLFNKMHLCIFRAPMSFFDATPSGRILNRASADQSAVDMSIPYQIGAFAFSIIQLLGIIAVMSQVAWQVFIVFIPVISVSIWYQQYYIPSARELSRLAGVCKAPVIQHFAETISGSTTIRSFDQESRFREINMKLADGYSRPKFHIAAAMEWLCFRLDMLSSITFVFFLVFLISIPEGVIDPGIAGLAVTYGLNLNTLQAVVIRCLCNLENQIISVERIIQYSSIPSEPPLVIEENRPDHTWPSQGEVDLIDLQALDKCQLGDEVRKKDGKLDSTGLIEEYDTPTTLLENKSSSFAQLVAEYAARSSSSF
ncbi:ABC transporter C family member 3 [Tripterygium wilfordii]|uniref:ABC-type xenobiotic transporter n=1 Tax=Tripterygium wilfordii TaxID=458696 RepID=A0A7J7C3W1_TRIWF|nr:ABC transporter C family member 3 [Tripterygium wilfordii]